MLQKNVQFVQVKKIEKKWIKNSNKFSVMIYDMKVYSLYTHTQTRQFPRTNLAHFGHFLKKWLSGGWVGGEVNFLVFC